MPKSIFILSGRHKVPLLYSHALQEAGYSVEVQGYELHIANRVRHADPQLIILDFALGSDRDGWVGLQAIMMNKDLVSTPILICVAPSHRIDDMRSQLRRKNITVLLTPFSGDELLAAVSAALGDNSLGVDLPLSYGGTFIEILSWLEIPFACNCVISSPHL